MARELTIGAHVTPSNRGPLAANARRAILCLHIVASVGLLGEVSGFLLVAIQAAGTEDPAFAATSYDLLATFSLIFGIPLSLMALISGVILGRRSKWGIFRYPWVTIKLGLIASVIVVGALLLGPTVDQLRNGDGNETLVIAGAAWDVFALTLATGLSVYKPGRRRPGRRPVPPGS